jgi:hypothetical protein
MLYEYLIYQKLKTIVKLGAMDCGRRTQNPSKHALEKGIL